MFFDERRNYTEKYKVIHNNEFENDNKYYRMDFLEPVFFSIRHGIINNNITIEKLFEIQKSLRLNLYKKLKDNIILVCYNSGNIEMFIKNNVDKIDVKQILEDLIFDLNIDDHIKDDIIYIIHQNKLS